MLKAKKSFAFITLLILIASSSLIVYGTSGSTSGNVSGDISTPISTTTPNSGEPISTTSGELSGDIISSGELTGSGELIDSGEMYLKSVAQDSSISTYKNTTVASTLYAQIASGEQNLTYIITEQPSHGTLLYEDNKSPSFSYTPDENFLGTDTFSFQLTDGVLFSNVAMVTITVAENEEPAIPFFYKDMQNHWANYSASQLASRGIIVGENIGGNYYFKPNTITTRGDFMLYLLAISDSISKEETTIPKITFEDEKSYPTWLLEYAKIAYAKGIIKGSASGNKLYLNLYNTITRSEAAVMINNILKASADSEVLKYADKSDIPSWALKSIKALTAYKIMQGDGYNLRPNSLITKAESIELGYKLLKQLEENLWKTNNSGEQQEDLK